MKKRKVLQQLINQVDQLDRQIGWQHLPAGTRTTYGLVSRPWRATVFLCWAAIIAMFLMVGHDIMLFPHMDVAGAILFLVTLVFLSELPCRDVDIRFWFASRKNCEKVQEQITRLQSIEEKLALLIEREAPFRQHIQAAVPDVEVLGGQLKLDYYNDNDVDVFCYHYAVLTWPLDKLCKGTICDVGRFNQKIAYTDKDCIELDRQIGLHRKLQDEAFNQELIAAGAEHAQVV